MFVISNQPRVFCPNSKSRPFKYEVLLDEHISQTGTLAFFQISFSTGGEPDGKAITLAGQLFTTESSIPFSFNTFDASGTAEEVRDNLLEALRSSYYFQDYILFSSSGGGSFTLQAFKNSFEAVDDWVFDTSSLTITHSITEANGQPYKYRNMRIWYRAFNDLVPVSNERFSDIPTVIDSPFFSSVVIDLSDLIGGLVRTNRPLFHTVGPTEDIAFSEQLHLKVGIIETDDDCNTVFTKSLQSAKSIAVNSVFQLDQTKEFKPHCLTFADPLVEFLTDRPTRMSICRASHEWAHIWIERIPNMVGDFRAIYSFYDDIDGGDGSPIAQTFLDFGLDSEAWQIDLGPGNPYIATQLAANPTTVRYTLQIWAQEFDGDSQAVYKMYSEKLTRILVSCNCKGAEIYYLEDRGSWRTMSFERVLRRSVVQSSSEYEQPVNFESGIRNSEIYADGGRYSEAVDVDHVFVLESPRFIERERSAIEQLLRSPTVLIKNLQ